MMNVFGEMKTRYNRQVVTRAITGVSNAPLDIDLMFHNVSMGWCGTGIDTAQSMKSWYSHDKGSVSTNDHGSVSANGPSVLSLDGKGTIESKLSDDTSLTANLTDVFKSMHVLMIS